MILITKDKHLTCFQSIMYTLCNTYLPLLKKKKTDYIYLLTKSNKIDTKMISISFIATMYQTNTFTKVYKF
jgi:hypothetical protein